MQQCEFTSLPGITGVRVDCFMPRGYLTGRRLRTPGSNQLQGIKNGYSKQCQTLARSMS